MTDTTRPAIACSIGTKAAEASHGSAIGGGAWRPDHTIAWPKDRRDVVMMHLARINFAEAPPLNGFPRSGILQVFISTEFVTLGEGEPHGEGFFIEFWPNPKAGISVPQPELDEANDEDTPLVSASPDSSMHDDGRSLGFAPTKMEKRADPKTRPEAWLGGWPLSVQETVASPTDVVLLQIGNGQVGKNDFMWGGDIGAATFLISPEDLEDLRFDRVHYDASGY